MIGGAKLLLVAPGDTSEFVTIGEYEFPFDVIAIGQVAAAAVDLADSLTCATIHVGI